MNSQEIEHSRDDDDKFKLGKELATKMNEIRDKGVSTVQQSVVSEIKKLQDSTNLPNQIRHLPSNIGNFSSQNLHGLKSNLRHPLKYVRKKITLQKLAFVGFQMMTGRVYYKLGMAVIWGLVNLAWKQYSGNGAHGTRVEAQKDSSTTSQVKL